MPLTAKHKKALRTQLLAEALGTLELTADDTRAALSDALNDLFPGEYTYIRDVIGNGESGDVIYVSDGDTWRAPYKIGMVNGKRTCTIDDGQAIEVVPRTVYDQEADESDLTGTTESGGARAAKGSIKLVEAVGFVEDLPADIPLRETLFKPGYQIKLIAPGKGASAFYPAEVLKRDGPTVFKAGTPMCINHPTKAEEAARPEGDVNNWGAVLAKDAYWLDEHKQGPGLYGEVKPFSDHVQTIHEKGPYAGVSIRANGNAVMEAGRPKLKDGLPILASLTAAESVDMVTRAGAGGMFLQESASRAQPQQETEMDEVAVKKLIESAVTTAVTAAIAGVQAPVKTLEMRALRGDATVEATRVLSGLALKETSKQFVIDNVLRGDLPLKEGALDLPKFTELVNAEAKRVAAVFAAENGSGRVIGMGAAQVEATEAAKPEEINARSVKIFQRLGLSEAAAKIAVQGRVA